MTAPFSENSLSQRAQSEGGLVLHGDNVMSILEGVGNDEHIVHGTDPLNGHFIKLCETRSKVPR